MDTWIYELYRLHLESMVGFLTPLVVAAVLVGIVVGLLQAFTSIKEESISYAGKLLAVFLVLLMYGAQYAERMKDLAVQAWSGGLNP